MSARHWIMGTSGHVDHGKTALIRLLTGLETDRLKEERERGISIELGFAHAELPDGSTLGIVDVPGHERFVKHMLAGAGGIDFVLFVVAADEGVMPQTVEHSQILTLLGVERGIIALTKIDMVDDDFRALVEEDVREFVVGTPMADWPIVPVSSITGEGKDALLSTIHTIATSIAPRGAEGEPRLPIDRVFTVEGFGTVVTGTLWEGSVREGDRVAIGPAGLPVRVRQVQVHGERCEEARAGSRTALALHGVDREQVARGDWVVPETGRHASSILDVRLRVVSGDDRPVRQRERIRFHLGATEVFGRVTLFDREILEPGEEDVAQIRLESPVVARRHDRFVARWYSPVRTCAGGHIIDAAAKKRRRSDAEAVEALNLRDSGTAGERIESILAGPHLNGLKAAEIATLAELPAAEVESALDDLVETGAVSAVGRDRYVSSSRRRAVEQAMCKAAADYQRRFPLRFGIPLSEVRSRLKDQVGPTVADAIARELAEGDAAIVREDRLRVGSDAVTLSAGDRQAAERVMQAVDVKTFMGPSWKQLLALAEGASDTEELLTHLTGAGRMVRLGQDLCYTPSRLEQLVDVIRGYFAGHDSLSVADFKDLTGVSRKYAVPLLEYLDQNGYTRREDDARSAGRRLHEAPATDPMTRA